MACRNVPRDLAPRGVWISRRCAASRTDRYSGDVTGNVEHGSIRDHVKPPVHIGPFWTIQSYQGLHVHIKTYRAPRRRPGARGQGR